MYAAVILYAVCAIIGISSAHTFEADDNLIPVGKHHFDSRRAVRSIGNKHGIGSLTNAIRKGTAQENLRRHLKAIVNELKSEFLTVLNTLLSSGTEMDTVISAVRRSVSDLSFEVHMVRNIPSGDSDGSPKMDAIVKWKVDNNGEKAEFLLKILLEENTTSSTGWKLSRTEQCVDLHCKNVIYY